MNILYSDYPQLTIRKSTDAEREEKFPPLVVGHKRIRIPKYVVVVEMRSHEHMAICSTFGLPSGGDTRAEAVFWAKRFASKNGYEYLAPKGWEDIEGKLPE